MYILFETDNTNMTFTLKDEAGTTIGSPYVFALADYKLQRFSKSDLEIIVLPVNEPDGAYPPRYSVPRDRIVFDNTATLPFQTENETYSEA